MQRPDSSYVTEFEDGTRFTVSAVQDESETSLLSEITIECAGFLQVTYRVTTQECSLLFPDDSTITCSNQGEYTVLKEGDYELCIESSGKAVYKLPNATNAAYVLDHTSTDCSFHGVDSQGNTYSLRPNSEATFEAANPIEHAAFAPRYFQLTPDQLAFELHKSSAVKEIIAEAELNPKVAVVKESLLSEPYITSTTLIEPVLAQTTPPTVASLWHSSIVPYNLRNGDYVPPSMATPHRGKKRMKFGSLVGKGLEIGSFSHPRPKSAAIVPLGLTYRQFLHMPPLDGDIRQEIYKMVASYISQRQEQVTMSQNMQPTELREASEVRLAESLNTKFVELNMGKVYASVMMQQRKKSFHPIPPSMSQEGTEFIEQSKEDLKAAQNTKMALRNRDIPLYFESKYAQVHLPTEPPDMPYLTSKLAHPPAASEAVTKSPSTLQSSSLTLTLDESDSLFQAEGHTAANTAANGGSPTTKRRHTHPAPTNAREDKMVSPLDLRPTNPTPMKAIVIDDNQLSTALAGSSPDKQVLAATLLDVTGKPRENAVPQPAALFGGRPGERTNVQVRTYIRESCHTHLHA